MRKIRRLAILGLGMLTMGLSTGCAVVVRQPVPGGLYSETTSPLMATSNPAGNRIGVACQQTILGAFASGDASIETARRNGGITMITSVDETGNSIALLYAKYCVVVRGR